MRIGIMFGAQGGGSTLDDLVARVRRAEAAGLDNAWLANIFSFDAITALALVGRETERLGLGTAVTPTYPRHPTAIAQQALTTQAACGGRFTLGIGLSHQMVIETMLGLSYSRRASHMREYLSVLMPLVRGETARFAGEEYRVRGVTLDIPGSRNMDVVVAALGPAMLRIAGELADGTNTWMVGERTMEEHVVKRIVAAASEAGRPSPKIVGGYPVVLTNKPDEARAKIAENLAIYGQLPSYRAMLDREGAGGPADVALVGDESLLRGRIRRLEDMGVTDFNGFIMDVEAGAFDRTLEFLAGLKG